MSQPDDLLQDFITVDEAARQLRKSKRTIYRKIERRELSFVPGTNLIHVPSSRANLLSRVVKAVAKRDANAKRRSRA